MLAATSERVSQGEIQPPKEAALTGAGNRHEECQYLELVQRILEQGETREDRTGTGVVSLFAPPQLRLSLSENVFPLLTTKRTFMRPIFEELMWFIRGKTDSKVSFKDVRTLYFLAQ
jgi:thymidylate synthase